MLVHLWLLRSFNDDFTTCNATIQVTAIKRTKYVSLDMKSLTVPSNHYNCKKKSMYTKAEATKSFCNKEKLCILCLQGTIATWLIDCGFTGVPLVQPPCQISGIRHVQLESNMGFTPYCPHWHHGCCYKMCDTEDCKESRCCFPCLPYGNQHFANCFYKTNRKPSLSSFIQCLQKNQKHK